MRCRTTGRRSACATHLAGNGPHAAARPNRKIFFERSDGPTRIVVPSDEPGRGISLRSTTRSRASSYSFDLNVSFAAFLRALGTFSNPVLGLSAAKSVCSSGGFWRKRKLNPADKAPGRTQFMLAWRMNLTPLEYALAQKWGRGGCILLRWFWASNLERGFRYEILPFSLRGAPTAGKKLDEWPGAWIPLSIRGSCAERPSCRVAEGFGPDDATTTGSALFAGRQVPIPARFAGDMKLGSEFSPHSPLPGMRHFFWHAGPGVARRPL